MRVRSADDCDRPGTLRQAIDATTVAMLRARGSYKWTAPGPDGLGAAVAEMDFGAAPAILDALAGLSADANFGYLPSSLADELAVEHTVENGSNNQQFSERITEVWSWRSPC